MVHHEKQCEGHISVSNAHIGGWGYSERFLTYSSFKTLYICLSQNPY